jgi:hypothetical protein
MENQGTRPSIPLARNFVRVPALEKKLSWLYGRHPQIRSDGDLAKQMGVSRTRIHELIYGKTQGGPGTFPIKSLELLCSFFADYVDRETMGCPDLDEFRRRIEERPRQVWARRLEDTPDTPDLEIVGNRTKGIVDPDEIELHGLPEFPA